MSNVGDAAGQALNPELAQYQRQFERIKQEVRELTKGLAESQFQWRQEPARWSMSEHLMHLNMSAEVWRKPLETAIEEARRSGPFSQGPFHYGFLGSLAIRNMEPPPKRKFRAGSKFAPVNGNPITALLPTFLHYQEELILRLGQANGLDLARIKLVLPGHRFLRLSLGQCFGFLAAHERRHLWHMREVRNHQQFPPEGEHRGRPNKD